MSHWSLDDIPWGDFEPDKVDADLLKIAKAASLVEFNAGEYADYLTFVFHDDPEFKAAALQWAQEEVQHGKALARWAELADPSFDFAATFRDFKATIQLPIGTEQSVRGSRTGELIARCVVEVGTSSYYSALANACEEPVLKAVCQKIAADEFRHYKLFYKHMKRYQPTERISLLKRARVAVGRISEADDDELAYAYYTANHADDGPYDNELYAGAYIRRAYGYYRPGHVERMTAMVFKAIGLKPNGFLSALLSKIAYRNMRRRVRKLSTIPV